MQEGRRRGAQLLTSAALAHSAAASIPMVQGVALQSLSALRLLSDVCSPLSTLSEPCSRLSSQQHRQHQRRQSHHAASTSSDTSRSRHAFSSSAAQCAANSVGASQERGFASQPAHAYEQPAAAPSAADAPSDAAATAAAAAAPVAPAHPATQQQFIAEHDLLGQAHAAAATLKARALLRLEEVSHLECTQVLAGSSELSFRERVGLNVSEPRDASTGKEPQRLKRVKEVQDMSPEVPAWERLSHMFSGHTKSCSGNTTTECSAALAVYRQEVLRGQDPEIVSTGGGFVHVPFLRSGMFAAQQGFSLLSDLSRLSLQSRLPPVEDIPVSRRTSSALEGLRVMMESSRTQMESPEGGVDGDALQLAPLRNPHHVLVLMAAAGSLAKAEAAKAEAAAAKAAAQGARKSPTTEEEELAADEHAWAELEDWEARREEKARMAKLARMAAQTRRSAFCPQRARLHPPPPPVEAVEVLQMLGEIEGVDPGQLRLAMQELYCLRAVRRPATAKPLAPLPLSEGFSREACLAKMREVAEVLAQDIGAGQFVELVIKAPWVLLLDAEKQGRPQLGCLHVIDMGRKERAKFLRSFPRLLTIDAEAHLLPLLEYLQGLGMSSRQIAKCLKGNPKLCEPHSLPALQAVAAFWLGKGMTKPDLAHMLAMFPKAPYYDLNTWQLKFDWLADHLDFTVRDVACMPGFVSRSLTTGFGPRLAFALSKDVKFLLPSESLGRGRSGMLKDMVGLSRFMRAGERDSCRRLRLPLAEFEAFRERWLQHDYPVWLEQRKGGIEQYRSHTGSRKRPTGAAAIAQAAQQQQQRESHLWEQQAAALRERELQEEEGSEWEEGEELVATGK